MIGSPLQAHLQTTAPGILLRDAQHDQTNEILFGASSGIEYTQTPSITANVSPLPNAPLNGQAAACLHSVLESDAELANPEWLSTEFPVGLLSSVSLLSSALALYDESLLVVLTLRERKLCRGWTVLSMRT